MGHKIIFNVDAKELIIPDCVRLSSGKSYEDTIIRDKEYFGESQITISFTNICSKQFDLESITLFENTDNGGNFIAKVDAFSIGANQTISVPLKYFGVCKSVNPTKNYLVSFNHTNVSFKLNVNQPIINHPPIIQPIDIQLKNRENYVFKLSDFTDKYSDLDEHEFNSVLLEGDLSSFRLNGASIASPIEISAYQINTGALSYIAKNTDDDSETIIYIKAKDSSGEISVNSVPLKVKNKTKCIAPTLVNVTQISNYEIEFAWKNNGMDYEHSLASLLLEMSIDGGNSYITLLSTNPISATQEPIPDLSEKLNKQRFQDYHKLYEGTSNGQLVKFRVSISNGTCSSMISNVVDVIWKKMLDAEIHFADSVGDTGEKGSAAGVNDNFTATVIGEGGQIATRQWEIKNIEKSDWTYYSDVSGAGERFENLPLGITEVRLKITGTNGEVAYSNVLEYMRLQENIEVPFCYVGEYQLENKGVGKTGSIRYVDQYGNEQNQTFFDEDVNSNKTWLIYYKQIISTENLTSKFAHGKHFTSPKFIEPIRVKVSVSEGSGAFTYIDHEGEQRSVFPSTSGTSSIEISIMKAIVSTKNVSVILLG